MVAQRPREMNQQRTGIESTIVDAERACDLVEAGTALARDRW
jgi:hypothetical protein